MHRQLVQPLHQLFAQGEGLDDFFFLWLFDEFGDSEVVLDTHEAEIRCQEGADRSGGDGDIGIVP